MWFMKVLPACSNNTSSLIMTGLFYVKPTDSWILPFLIATKFGQIFFLTKYIKVVLRTILILGEIKKKTCKLKKVEDFFELVLLRRRMKEYSDQFSSKSEGLDSNYESVWFGTYYYKYQRIRTKNEFPKFDTLNNKSIPNNNQTTLTYI